MNYIQVALDGPAGAGKSTIAKYVADNLGFLYVDTGAMYRGVAYYFLKNGIEICEDSEEVKEHINDIAIKLVYKNGKTSVILNGIDVTEEIRMPEISSAASKVAVIECVRVRLANMQRNMAKNGSIIMDGRDIGTNVLPNAQIKIFLTATSSDRAKRRTLELEEKGVECNFEKVKSEIEERDYNDSHRKHSPLKKADAAVVIDTTGNSLEQSKNIVLSFVKERVEKIV